MIISILSQSNYTRNSKIGGPDSPHQIHTTKKIPQPIPHPHPMLKYV